MRQANKHADREIGRNTNRPNDRQAE
jgi:hypothetical protein